MPTRIDPVPVFTPDGRRELCAAAHPARAHRRHLARSRCRGIDAGTALRLSRGWAPRARSRGHRFNPHKLLIDPYAKALEGRLKWSDALMGYKIGAPAGRPFARHPRQCLCRAEGGGGGWAVLHLGAMTDPPSDYRPLSETVIYEAHVKSMTAGCIRGCQKRLRGSYAALGHPATR